MILDYSPHELIPKFVCSNSIHQPLTENSTIYKEHCREEEVPENRAQLMLKYNNNISISLEEALT